MPAKRLTLADVTIAITPEEEDESPRSSYAVPGIVDADSDDADRFVVAVEEMIDEHGLWGWCMVRVDAKLGPLVGHAYLGGSSYADEDDFKRGGYYEQMCDEALDDLQDQVDELYPLIEG